MKNRIARMLALFLVFLVCLYGCSNNKVTFSEPHISTNDGNTVNTTAPSSETVNSSSKYVRQQWAQELLVRDIKRIDLIGNDIPCQFATYSGENLYPLVEVINSINGQFVAEPIVAGNPDDFILCTIYVFMADDTRYTIQKIAGKECNYISIDNSVFLCDDELFAHFPETGTGLIPENYVIAGSRPQEIPKD